MSIATNTRNGLVAGPITTHDFQRLSLELRVFCVPYQSFEKCKGSPAFGEADQCILENAVEFTALEAGQFGKCGDGCIAQVGCEFR
jgi:hypothetical protein